MVVVKENVPGKVLIDDVSIDGFIYDKTCKECGSRQVYYEYYDALFCPACNLWLEELCSDVKCVHHCNERPDRPLQIGKI